MAEKFVEGRNEENAVLLLAAAEKAKYHKSVVRTVDGGFMVPEDIAGAVDDKKGSRAQNMRQPEGQRRGLDPELSDASNDERVKAASKGKAETHTVKSDKE